jgi:Outer membrane protein beta-barrel domain
MTTCRGSRRFLAVVAETYPVPHQTSARSELAQTSKIHCSIARESTLMPSTSLWTLLICGLLVQSVVAQGFNVNIGGGPGFPVSRTSDFADTSYHFVAGAGPNLRPYVKLDGEFMFHGLPVQQSVVNELNIPSAKGRLYSFTGNIMVGTGDIKKSVYLIGGGGWYRRTVETQQTVYQAGEVCVPALVWWNVQCVNGVFPTDVTIGSHSSNAGGFNIGGGLTFAIGSSGAHLYTEVRFHHAFTDGVETTVLPLTFGVRW